MDFSSYGKGRLSSSRYRAAVEQHIVQIHLAGILHPERNHCQAVTDKDDVHAGMVGNVGTGKVVRGNHGDGLLALVHLTEGVDGHLFAQRGCIADGRVRAVPFDGTVYCFPRWNCCMLTKRL